MLPPVGLLMLFNANTSASSETLGGWFVTLRQGAGPRLSCGTLAMLLVLPFEQRCCKDLPALARNHWLLLSGFICGLSFRPII